MPNPPQSAGATSRPSARDLVEESLSKVELESHDAQGVRPGLEALADAVVCEKGLTPAGLQRARDGIDDSLRRLAVIRSDRRSHPDIERVQIAPQIFILGMPRCGTSILHALLASDPQFRAPLMWEVAAPSPPPEASTFDSDPRAQAFDDYVRSAFAGEWQDVLKAHPIGARVPQECGMILETAFCSANPAMLFRVPSFFDWFLHTDTSYGYEVHRMWLQHLQWRALGLEGAGAHVPHAGAGRRLSTSPGGAAAPRPRDRHCFHIAPHSSDSQQQFCRAGSGGAGPRDARAVESRSSAFDGIPGGTS
jgi:hypothetical protein